jgi:hypothetical protein
MARRMSELRRLAKEALTASHDRHIAPQRAFLEALAIRLARAPGFRAPGFVTAQMRILSDGTLSVDAGLTVAGILAGGTENLVTIVAKMAALAPDDLETQRAAEIVLDRRPLA